MATCTYNARFFPVDAHGARAWARRVMVRSANEVAAGIVPHY